MWTTNTVCCLLCQLQLPRRTWHYSPVGQGKQRVLLRILKDVWGLLQ